MFNKLQKKWNVSGWRFLLIMITFAIGGSLTGLAGKQIMPATGIESPWLYVPVYIILVTLIWPIMVLIVSIPFGQFAFFTSYLKKMGKRMKLVKGDIDPARVKNPKSYVRPTQKRIAIFASGAGSNAQKIIDHFRNNADVKVALIVCNKPGAGVLNIAQNENIPVLMINKDQFISGDGNIPELLNRKIDFIVLAGFLWKVPMSLIHHFRNRIVNIHPALLPKHGGKGFYGQHVHRSVLDTGSRESGITIHYVDEHYDHGDIILQVKCPVMENDTPESLAERIHALEHANYPVVIEKLVNSLN